MLRAYLASLTRKVLAKANRSIVALNAWGANPVADAFKLLRNQTENPTVFDVGANSGQFARACLEIHPRCMVHAFEPFPEVFQELKKLQHCYGSRVSCHCLALDEAPGTLALHINSESVTNSLLPNASEASSFQPENYAAPKGKIQVVIETLSNFCEANQIDQIDLLKTDAQGTDLRVLKGAETLITEGRIGAVLTEVLFVPLYQGQGWFHETYAWLTSRGFCFVNFYDMHHHHEQQVKWADALFIHKSYLREPANLTTEH